MQLDITLIIIIITTLVSIGGFSSHKIMDDLIFYPPAVTRQRRWVPVYNLWTDPCRCTTPAL